MRTHGRSLRIDRGHRRRCDRPDGVWRGRRDRCADRLRPDAALGWKLLRDSGRILLEGSSQDVDAGEVGRAPAQAEGVVEVHDLHVWEVTSGFPAMSAHVLVGEGDDCHARRAELERLLHDGSRSSTRPCRSTTNTRSSRSASRRPRLIAHSFATTRPLRAAANPRSSCRRSSAAGAEPRWRSSRSNSGAGTGRPRSSPPGNRVLGCAAEHAVREQPDERRCRDDRGPTPHRA